MLITLVFSHRLRIQIPDLERSLDMIKILKKHQNATSDFETQFLLSDQVYMKASIPPTDKVCLWLGVSTVFIIGDINKTS